jgi:nucleoside-diphosphate-sugar epimerase
MKLPIRIEPFINEWSSMDIFVTGAAGYIGGSLSQAFVADGHLVRGLVRSQVKAEALEQRGITPVLGELDDQELLAQEAGRSDVIINAASTLHMEAAKALVYGARMGTKLVHTSGIGAYSEDVQGLEASVSIVEDDPIPDAGPHPMQQLLRTVENIFLDAAASGKHPVVLSNALIYGEGMGITRESTQVPMMLRAAVQAGYVPIIGTGANIWSTVHISDVVNAYRLAVDSAPAGSFYFVASGEASFADIGQALARRLQQGQPRHMALQEAAQIYGEMPARYLLATSSRVRGKRLSRELGWSPTQPAITEWIGQHMLTPSAV